MDDSQLTQAERLVKPQYEKLQCWTHAWLHIQSVRETSEELAQLVGADPILCGIAVCCHDLGRIEEERMAGKLIEYGNVSHSSLSIEPTVAVLQELGIRGYNFGAIVEAVKVHSKKIYTGENLVAKVLRDADKKDSLGPWGSLRIARHNFGRDLISTDLILANVGNQETIRELADQTHGLIKKDEQLREAYLNVLDFVLEWVDKKMLDTNPAYDLLKEGHDYTRQAKKYLRSYLKTH